MIEKLPLAFDLEGTMVDLEAKHQLAFEHIASNLGIRFGEQEFHNFVGVGDGAISKEVARLCAIMGRNIDPQEVRSMKNKIYQDILHSSEIEPREGVVIYLDKARALGGELVVASLTPVEPAMNILQRSRLQPFFKYVLTEVDVKKIKPDPEVYLMAAEYMSVSPHTVLVHEDSPPGVEAAKSAGSYVVAFPVHDALAFDPAPDAIYISWIGLDPADLYGRLVK